MQRQQALRESNRRLARAFWKDLSAQALANLDTLTLEYGLSVSRGDLILLDSRWYVTHTGLLGIARRNRCAGIHVESRPELSDRSSNRWAFRAIVFKSRVCRGFVGFGDAEPSTIAPAVYGAEMRVAETRAVNRALRKAYGIGICSVEEIGSLAAPVDVHRDPQRLPPQPTNGNGNMGGPRLRDRLCQIIRQHQLDPTLVKSYAVDFCRVKSLRDASREQVENFVVHLADWAEKDRNALLCQLNSYLGNKEGAA